MSRIIIGVLFALSFGLSANLFAQVARPSTAKIPNINRRVAIATTELVQDVRAARNLLQRVTDRKLRDEIEALLMRAETNLELIATDLALEQAFWNPLSDVEFQKLLSNMKKQRLSSRKAEYLLDYVRLASQSRTGNRLTSAQVKLLLAEIEFDSDQSKAAIALFDLTSDKQNYLTAIDAITFDKNRQAVAKRLNLRK